jgi:hypothetical protein
MTERKSYLEDLEFWLWITKGSRFSAHERCIDQNKWSNFAVGLLSAYIIIINLVATFKLSGCTIFSNEVIGFTTTALSILILVFSQLENSNEWKLKAEMHHSCAKDLSNLYRKVRTLKYEATDPEILRKELNELTGKYEEVLSRHENHKEIDYEYYQATHAEDFKLGWIRKPYLLFKHYVYTIFIYHVLILLPPGLFIYLLGSCS